MVKLCTVDIRPLARTELASIARVFRAEHGKSHGDDLDRQDQDEILFLVAWQSEDPLGHALIHWSGGRDGEVARMHPTCPEVYRFDVLEMFQSQGVGTCLMEACEEAVRERGLRIIGLGVAHANPRAKALYERLGYVGVEPHTYLDEYQYRDGSGAVVTASDPCGWMMKSL